MEIFEQMMLSNEIHTYTALLLKFHNESLEQRLRNYGVALSGLQHGILQMLQFEALTISTISQRMGMDPSSIMRIIDSLERKELVARGVDPQDRRRNPILITERGRDLLAAVPAISAEDPSFQALLAMGSEKSEQLRDLLREVMQYFPEGRMVSGLISGAIGLGRTNQEERPTE